MNENLESSISKAIHGLVEVLEPKQVYLFGSCAKGNARADSDIDLLVVLPDNSGDKLNNTRKAYEATREIPFAKDIIVDHESVFKKRSRWVSSIEREVLETGKLVYGRS